MLSLFPMQRAAHTIILLALGLGAFVGSDLVRTLRTGRVRGRLGAFTEEKQRQRFWRYVYGDWLILALCALTIVWALIRPETFQ